MQLRQVAQPSIQMVTEALCDDGVGPRPSTAKRLDFTIGNDGRLYPTVTLGRNSEVISIKFAEGFDVESLRRDFPTLRAALRSVEVLFVQEDPTGNDLIVLVACNHEHVEQRVVLEPLRAFFDFVYEDAIGDNNLEEED